MTVKLVHHTVCQQDKQKRPLYYMLSTTTTEVALAADS